MKSKAAILWFGVSVVLAIALVMQWNAGKAKQQKLEKLQLQVEQIASKPDATKQVKELEKERMKLLGELRAAEHELRTVQMTAAAMQATNAASAQLTSTGSNSGDHGSRGQGMGAMGKMLENMMKDPEMRKAMEQQQRMGMDMVYGALFKQLNLTPEQQEKFKDMLIAQQMENMSQAGSMFEGTAEERSKMAQELGEKQKANEQKLKELIGEDKFAQYQEYNQTIGERMLLEQFGRSADITPEQNEQLLAIFAEEKRNVQINTGTDMLDPTRGMQAIMGEEGAAERIFAQQEEVNQRVLERASQVLTPEQWQKFEPVLRNQTELQRAGLKMAREMFGGRKNGEQAAPAQ